LYIGHIAGYPILKYMALLPVPGRLYDVLREDGRFALLVKGDPTGDVERLNVTIMLIHGVKRSYSCTHIDRARSDSIFRHSPTIMLHTSTFVSACSGYHHDNYMQLQETSLLDPYGKTLHTCKKTSALTLAVLTT
jgi:hypothetical protein